MKKKRDKQKCNKKGMFKAEFIRKKIIMPPTSKKLTEHIVFGLSVPVSVCSFVTLFDACRILWTMHARALKFHILIPHGKITDTSFSYPSYLPFWSNALPRLKKSGWHLMHAIKSGWHLMHAISYQLCMLRCWNFHIWHLHWKIADPYFFLVRVISLSGVMTLWKKSE